MARTKCLVPQYTALPGTDRVPATEEVTRMCPRFWAMNWGSTAAMALSTPLMLISTMSIQSETFPSERLPPGMMPALAKSASMPPNFSLARAASACMSARRVTSAGSMAALAPSSAASASSRSLRRAPNTTLAPRAASARAAAAPIPEEAPVMMTTLFSMFCITCPHSLRWFWRRVSPGRPRPGRRCLPAHPTHDSRCGRVQRRWGGTCRSRCPRPRPAPPRLH